MSKKRVLNKRQRIYIMQCMTVILSVVITAALAVFITLYLKEKNKAPEEIPRYVITFDANGGVFPSGGIFYSMEAERDSLIYPSRIPTKDNMLLEYWSTDKHGDNVWYFDTETVSKNVTLYAVWREAVTLIFDPNGGTFINGVNAMAVNLSKGTAPSVQNPTYDGFVFAGWFVGDEEWNGIAYGNLNIKAKWVYRDDAVLDTPEVITAANGFYWQSVRFAKNYAVEFENERTGEVVYEETVDKTSFLMTEDIPAGIYRVSVTALGNDETTINSLPAEFIYRFRCLDEPQVYYDTVTNTVHWFKVANAETYAVYVDDTIVYEGEDTIFDLAGYQAGSKVRVAAAAEGYYPSSSNTTVKVKKLATPVLAYLLLDEGEVKLGWSVSYGADTYVLDFGGETPVEVNDIYYDFPVDSEFIVDGKFSVSIQAKDSEGNYLKSEKLVLHINLLETDEE